MTFEQLYISKPLDQFEATYSYEETKTMLHMVRDIPRHEDTENLMYAIIHFGNVAAIMEWELETAVWDYHGWELRQFE